MLTVVAGRPLVEGGQDLLDALRVLLVPLVLGVHHQAGVDDLALGDERQHRDPRLLLPVARGERDDAALVGRAHLGADVDPQALEQRRERAELARVVVVAGDQHARRSARRRAARGSRRRASRPRAAGAGESKTSPAIRTASTWRSIAISATWSRALAYSSIRERPRSGLPMCQSAVWRNLTVRAV